MLVNYKGPEGRLQVREAKFLPNFGGSKSLERRTFRAIKEVQKMKIRSGDRSVNAGVIKIYGKNIPWKLNLDKSDGLVKIFLEFA